MATGFETKAQAQDRIDGGAGEAGRDPAEVRRVIQLVGSVTDRAQTLKRPLQGPGSQPIRTTPEMWATIIAEFAAQERFDTVNFVPQMETAEQIAAFGDSVIPVAKQTVAAGRPR